MQPLGSSASPFSTAPTADTIAATTVSTTTAPNGSAADQLVIDSSLLLITLFTESNGTSDLLGRVALPIANQVALNLAGYLAATMPTTTAPNPQEEEAVFSNHNPFVVGGGGTSSSTAAGFLFGNGATGYSSVAKASHVFHANPRFAAVQALVAVTRRFQLTSAVAKEVIGLAEKHIMTYLGLCQLFGDAANVAGCAGVSSSSSLLGGGGGSSLSLGGGLGTALSTFMTIQHNTTHLVLIAFANTFNSWGSVFARAAGAGAGANAATYDPSALLGDAALGKEASTWISVLKTKIVDSAGQHITAIAASLNGGATTTTAAASKPLSPAESSSQDRARAAVVQNVDGFVAIATLIVGLFRVAQNDSDNGLDFVIDAFRGDRRDTNSPDPRSGALQTFIWRGKVAKRLTTFCPPSSRLRLPNWFVPEVYFEIINMLTSDAVLPALKHLSDLDVESCRAYSAALEEASALRQQQQSLQQAAFAAGGAATGLGLGLSFGHDYLLGNSGGGGFIGGGRAPTLVGRTGSALTGAPAQRVVAAPAVACYPYTSAMGSICDLLSLVFTVLPSHYLTEPAGGSGAADGGDFRAESAAATCTSEGDNNVATFIFRNYIYHLKELYEVSGRSGVDGFAAAAAASSTLGMMMPLTASAAAHPSSAAGGVTPQEAAGLWDVFALRASASYSGLLSRLAGLGDPSVAARIFATVLGESQQECTELQWGNLLRQVRLALSVIPANAVVGGGAGAPASMLLPADASLGAASLYSAYGNRGLPQGLLGGSDPFRFTEARGPNAVAGGGGSAPTTAPELSAEVLRQASLQSLIAAQQAFATNALTLIANVATSTAASNRLAQRDANTSSAAMNASYGGSMQAVAAAAISRAVPAEAVLSLLDSRMLSPDALGAVLSAATALMGTAESRLACWAMLEGKGLLRVSNNAAAATANAAGGGAPAVSGGSSAWGGGLSGAGAAIVADAEINSLPGHCLRECRVGSYPITTAFVRMLLQLIAIPSAPSSGPAASLSLSVVSVPSSTADATRILDSPTFRSLLKFITDDIVCSLNRRAYCGAAGEDDLYVLTALTSELLSDALLTFGPNVAQLSGAPTANSAAAAASAPSASAVSCNPAYQAFHALMGTSRAPNDVLTQILILINEAVADMSAQHPLSAARRCALRTSLKLLYGAMHAVSVDKGLASAVYTFTSRTFDNCEFVIAIIRLLCGCVHDDRLARRCIAILGLLDAISLSATVRMIMAPTSSHGDLVATARYVLASAIDGATDSCVSSAFSPSRASEGDDSGSAEAAEADALGLPSCLRCIDTDHLADADVPSTAACLLDLLIRNAHHSVPSLTSLLCGYELSTPSAIALALSTGAAAYAGDLSTAANPYAAVAGGIAWEGSCLEVVVAKMNDGAFRADPRTAPLATRCAELVYALMCNPTTSTPQFEAILSARGNYGFLRSAAAVGSGHHHHHHTCSHRGEEGSGYSQGISLYDSVSTERASITLHQLTFAGYAFRMLALHLHRLSQRSRSEAAGAQRAFRDAFELGGVTLRSTRPVAGPSAGRFTSEAARVGGTSVVATSHDPLIMQLRKMVRLFSSTNGYGGSSTNSSGAHYYPTAAAADGVVDSDGAASDEDVAFGTMGIGVSSTASSAAAGAAFGRRMLEVVERLPPYPVLSVPGGATENFIVQTSNSVPQYSIPALSVAFSSSFGTSMSREEVRESLRIFVFANSCLMAYKAATTYLKGWAELLEVYCANAAPAELDLAKLLSLAGELVAAIGVTDKLTIAAQQEIVTLLSQTLCTVTMKMSEVRAAASSSSSSLAGGRWASEGSHTLQNLSTAVIRSLVRFRDVSSPCRLNLYNVIRTLLSLAPLQVEPHLLPEDRDAIFDVIVSDICSTAATTPASAFLSASSDSGASELVALYTLRRFLQLPDALTYFAVSARTTVSAANTIDTTVYEGGVTGSMMTGGATSASASMLLDTSKNPLIASAAEDCFWSPSARLVAVVRSVARTVDAACCALFAGSSSSDAGIAGAAAYLLDYADCATDIIALTARRVPHVLYNSGAVEALLGMQCWGLIGRAFSEQGSVAVITARYMVESQQQQQRAAMAGGGGMGGGSGGPVSVSPQLLTLLREIGARAMMSVLGAVNALLEDRTMRQHKVLIASCADFLRANIRLFQVVCKGSNYGARNAAAVAAGSLPSSSSLSGGRVLGSGLFSTPAEAEGAAGIVPIHTSQLRLVEEVSLFISALGSSHLALECRSLIQLLGLTDLLLSFTAPEMLTHAFFVDDEDDGCGGDQSSNGGGAYSPSSSSSSPFATVPLKTITYAQIGHVARTVRNLASFLLSTIHPTMLRMRQQEAAIAEKVVVVSAPTAPSSSSSSSAKAGNGANSTNAGNGNGGSAAPNKSPFEAKGFASPLTTPPAEQNSGAKKAPLAAPPADVWPLLEGAFMTAIGVVLHQLNHAVATTVEWELRSGGGALSSTSAKWHSRLYLDATNAVVLLTHSAVLQCLLTKKDQPHLFSATASDSTVKALAFHSRHLAASLGQTFARQSELLAAVLASSSLGGGGGVAASGGLLGGGGSILGGGSGATSSATLADALDRLNNTNGSVVDCGVNSSSGFIARSRVTGGAAFEGRDGLVGDTSKSFSSSRFSGLMPASNSAMAAYQSIQRTRSLVMAACRDAEQLLANQ